MSITSDEIDASKIQDIQKVEKNTTPQKVAAGLGAMGHDKPLGLATSSSTWNIYICYMCQGLNSHYFHIIGDVHQPNSRGLYTHCKDSY